MYNGWANYETWLCFSWFSNEEQLYRVACEAAQSVREASELAELYKGHVISEAPELETGIYRDLLRAAIGKIDFQEIAEAFLEGEKDK